MTQDFSQKRATNFITSPNAGFVFPMPEIIKNIDPAEQLSVDAEGNKTISKLELLKAMFASAKKAWEKGIQPHITEIRKDPSGSSTAKGEGLDFFTKADSASERIIKQYLIDKFGTETLRIFAEEINDYTGNLASQITVRIDPIDGTEVFKSGKPDWGIMIGVYKGAPIEQQQMAGVYYPEYNQVMYHIDKLPTFIADTHTAEIKEVTPSPLPR